MGKKIWTLEEIKYLKENYSKEDMDIMIKKLNKSKSQITSKAKSLGLKRDMKFLHKNKRLRQGNLIMINNRIFKKCKTCNKYVEIEMFYKNNLTYDGLAVSCKECVKRRSKKYIQENKQKVVEYQKQYRKNNREKLNEYSKNWYYENHDDAMKIYKKYRIKNKEKINRYIKEYRKTKRGKELHRINQQKRRSKKRELESSLTLEEWKDTLNYWTDKENNIHCAYCGKIINNEQHQEHIIPLSKGGGYTKNNIIPSCKECNFSKSNKNLEEFFLYSDTFTVENYNKIIEFLDKHISKEVC
jgi:hypothetical protein